MKSYHRFVRCSFKSLLVVGLASLVASAAAQTLNFNLLHTFTNSPDGALPGDGYSYGVPPLLDSKGNLFGTTTWGGAANCVQETGCGTVYRINKRGNYSVLYSFTGGSDGSNPWASLSEDAAGNLYGAATGNGSIPAPSSVFKLTQAGELTVLHDFTGVPDGNVANTTPILDAAGNLYGTTLTGGFVCNSEYFSSGCGVIYRVDAKGQYNVIHTFKKISDGFQPQGLAMDAAGNLYGSTGWGGETCLLGKAFGCGTVYKLDRSGKYRVLHRFKSKDGEFPNPVTVDAAGNVYGIAVGGGDTKCSPPDGCGTIFKIDTAGQFSVLYTFTSAVVTNVGYNTPVLDSHGNFYDTTSFNQPGNGGFLFKLDTRGTSPSLLFFRTISMRPRTDCFRAASPWIRRAISMARWGQAEILTVTCNSLAAGRCLS